MKSNGIHLVEKQRDQIEIMLNEGKLLKEIAAALGRDPRGIKYEIVTHRQLMVDHRFKTLVVFKPVVLNHIYAIPVLPVNVSIVLLPAAHPYAMIIPLILTVKLVCVFLMSAMGVKKLNIVLFLNSIINPIKPNWSMLLM